MLRYSIGICFWYWDEDNNNNNKKRSKIYIKQKFKDLKEEITLKIFNAKLERSSNGNDVHIYKIQANEPITPQ